ncbi:paralemmin-3 [Engraulis encrasicolus]|uniref:paralemmin-3 n=1 Tax=Engraulis encrasicolus TaxID=184585 RepID=UPI002FD1FD79
MDEAEKYQQRLQAIAEKRRLAEEQERVKREMEDERIRLQQLKRKSLRDQWLMEGPPMSPTSPTTPTSPDSSGGPRSPLWGAQAREIERNIDSLQAEAERLTEEAEKITEDGEPLSPVKDGVTLSNNEGVHILGDSRTEPTAKEAVLQNGQGNGTTDVEDSAPSHLPQVSEVTAVMAVAAAVVEDEKGPNGEVPSADMPALVADAAVEEAVAMATSTALSAAMPTTNGLAGNQLGEEAEGGEGSGGGGGGDGAVTLRFLGLSEAGQGVAGLDVDMDDDGGAIMRAERVIIMEETGDEDEDEEEEEGGGEGVIIKGQAEQQQQQPVSESAPSSVETPADASASESQESREPALQAGAEASTETEKGTEKATEAREEVATKQAGEVSEQRAAAAEPTEQQKAEGTATEEKKEGVEEEKGEEVVREVPGAGAEAAPVSAETPAAVTAESSEAQPQPELPDGAAAVPSEVPVYSPAVQPTPTAAPSTGAESQPPAEGSESKTGEEKEEGGSAAAAAPAPDVSPTPAPATASASVSVPPSSGGPGVVKPSSPSGFQDVPLDDQAINPCPKPPRLADRQAEQEPLLTYKAAAPTEASSSLPRRADAGVGPEAPKQKSCECCTIM